MNDLQVKVLLVEDDENDCSLDSGIFRLLSASHSGKTTEHTKTRLVGIPCFVVDSFESQALGVGFGGIVQVIAGSFCDDLLIPWKVQTNEGLVRV